MRGLLIGALALVGYGCTPEEDKPACTADAQCTGDGERCVSGVCEVVPCEDGDVRACDFDGVEGCRATQRCAGGVYGACEVPEERCNGVDDDCDGSTDEDFAGLGDACEDGVGECIDRGRVVCSGDGQSTRCAARAGDGGAELCDGFDNDCDGETDEETGGAACATGLPGACAAGASVCEKGDLSCAPVAEPTDEVCDGVDNDCDGRTDEAAAGGPIVEPCYDGPDGTADTGVCATGFRACFGGRFGACEDQVLPGAEVCDGLDNDCNGEADDGEVECVCVPGEVRECYTGPEGTLDVGYCQGGEQACAADGSAWGACLGQVVPGVERCDSIDTDCDGAVDEVPGVGEPCGGGVGACAVEGILECDIGFGQVICSERPGLPGDEICNGIDDDCNGLVDDVEGAGVACRVGEGACGQAGVIACGPDGALACDAEPGAPGEETCNGIDDDCDGVVDDVEGLGDACEVGVGACRSTGFQICGAGRLTCGAVEQPAGVELCGNNVDDDCDGEVDDADVCSRCGNGERNLGETCDDGNREAGDGCDAECMVEEGFECFDGPADTPVTVDGRDCRGTDIEVPAWVGGYGVGYVGGAVQIAADARYVGAYAVDVGVGPAQTISIIVGYDDNGRFLEAPTAGGARARIAGRFDRLPAGNFAVRFPDINCSDNAGAVDVEFRTLDLCRPIACDVDADCVFDDQLCFEGECLPRACGDGQRGDGEACDDGGRVSGDGCSGRCEVEDGFACVTGPDGRDACSPTCAIDSNCPDPADRCVEGVCAVPAPACGDGEVNGDDGCDDGNTAGGDGCAADCTVEPGAVCEDFSFRFGVADTIPFRDPAPDWLISGDGRAVGQRINGAPAHYASNLPISPDYVARFEVAVNTDDDDDLVGWAIGGGPTALSAPDQPYLLFSWKQGAQPDAELGFAPAGLRVGVVDTGAEGAVTASDLWSFDGAVTELALGATQGELGWVDNRTYTIEIVGDSARLWVYVDGVLEFDLRDVPLGDGNLGLYTLSQAAFRAELISPETIQVCRPAEAFCGDGEVGDDEECDDGNADDGDGCAADCTAEPDFACEDFSFGFGATDRVPYDGLPAPNWRISEDGRTITQIENGEPGHYATELPISPDYRTRFEVGVNTVNDDDVVGWTIGGGATALTAPEAPYLLFSWKQGEQDNPELGLALAGLRVGRVDGPVTFEELWQFNGPVTELAVGATQGELGWVDNQTYTVEIIGDGQRLMVYVDGVLEFDLADAPLGDGRLGLYTSSQEQFAATLIAPLTLQVCQPITSCGDGEVGDDEECDDGNTDDGDGCAADCTAEPDFTCEDFSFGFGATDTVPYAGLPEPDWGISEDGRTITQLANAQPGHYATELPISPDYRTRFEVGVNVVNDDDLVGWTIGGGATALTAPEAPYLLFSWKQTEQDDPDVGFAPAGLRVGRVDGPVTFQDLWQFNGPVTELAVGATQGELGWVDNQTYTVEIIGDGERLMVYVDGVLEFDLADAPLGDGKLGLYTSSQQQFAATLIAPLTLQVCQPITSCGDGEVGDDEECDDGNTDDGDGCAADCTREPDFVCEEFDFGLGQTDTFRTAGHNPPVWTASEDGRSISQAVNGYPSHYSTDLPISPDYVTRFEIGVDIAQDDDIIGFAIGGGPTALTAPEQPYLLFSWRGGDALGSPLGDVFAGLRVDRVDGAPSAQDLIFSSGTLSPVAEAETLGRTPWAYFETYTVEIVGDGERLQVFVDGVLQFDLADAPIGDGRFGFYTNSQPGFTGTLIAPETLQVCRPVAVEICDNWIDDDGDGQMDCDDPDCADDPFCQAAALCPGDDAFEPNDAPAEARLLAPGAYPDLYWCGADDPGEWFAVDVCAGGRLLVEMDYAAAAGNVDLELWRPVPGGEPVQLFVSRTAFDRDFINYGHIDDDERMLLRVLGAPNTYSLSVDVTECGPREICDDGVDNDNSGLTDCADPDCAREPVCFCAAPDPFENDEVSFTYLVPGDGLSDMVVCAGTDPVDSFRTYGCPPASMTVDTTFVQFPLGGAAPTRDGLRFTSNNGGVRFDLDPGQAGALIDITALTPAGCDPGQTPTPILPGGQDIRIAGVLDADDTQLDIGCADGVVAYQIVRITNDQPVEQVIDVTADFRDRAGSVAVLREPLDGPAVPDACPNPGQGVRDLPIAAGEAVSIAVFDVDGAAEANQFVVRVRTVGEFAEVCGSTFDEDGDGAVDCGDPDCAADPSCAGGGGEVCVNGFDDDANGVTDCDDPACAADPACAEPVACGVLDPYGDGARDAPTPLARGDFRQLIACDGPDEWYVTRLCPGGSMRVEMIAYNSPARMTIDVPALAPEPLLEQDVGPFEPAVGDVFNDRAEPIDIYLGYADLEPDGGPSREHQIIVFVEGCPVLEPFELCGNGVDDDGDGAVDCDDAACAETEACNPELCANGIDDTGNGRIDCNDPGCRFDEACSLSGQVYFTVPTGGGGGVDTPGRSPTLLYSLDNGGRPVVVASFDSPDGNANPIQALAVGLDDRFVGIVRADAPDGTFRSVMGALDIETATFEPLTVYPGRDIVGAAFNSVGEIWGLDRAEGEVVLLGAAGIVDDFSIPLLSEFVDDGDIAFLPGERSRFVVTTTLGAAPIYFAGDTVVGTATRFQVPQRQLARPIGAALAFGRGINRCAPELYSVSSADGEFGWMDLGPGEGFGFGTIAGLSPFEGSFRSDGASRPQPIPVPPGCADIFEACDGVDGDGDGLIGCDDPDCQRTDPICIAE